MVLKTLEQLNQHGILNVSDEGREIVFKTTTQFEQSMTMSAPKTTFKMAEVQRDEQGGIIVPDNVSMNDLYMMLANLQIQLSMLATRITSVESSVKNLAQNHHPRSYQQHRGYCDH